MHMRRSKMKQYNLRRKIRPSAKDSEGNTIEAYEAPVEISATIWKASGKLQLEMYGERLSNIKNMEYEGKEPMQEGDGVCVEVAGESNPDYRIISVNKDSSPIRIELERI